MDTNLYALEKQVQSKLGDARAMSAQAALLSSLRAERRLRPPVLAMIAAMFTGRHGRLRDVSAGAPGA